METGWNPGSDDGNDGLKREPLPGDNSETDTASETEDSPTHEIKTETTYQDYKDESVRLPDELMSILLEPTPQAGDERQILVSGNRNIKIGSTSDEAVNDQNQESREENNLQDLCSREVVDVWYTRISRCFKIEGNYSQVTSMDKMKENDSQANSMDKIKENYLQATSMDKIECSICTNTYTNMTDYTHHLNVHLQQEEKRELLKCNLCELLFLDRRLLESHGKLHTGHSPIDVIHQHVNTTPRISMPISNTNLYTVTPVSSGKNTIDLHRCISCGRFFLEKDLQAHVRKCAYA